MNALCFLLALTIHSRPGVSKTDARPQGGDAWVCGTGPQRERDARMRGRYQQSLMRRRPAQGRVLLQQRAAVLSQDQGNIAVLENDGTLVTEPNLFDLQGRSFLFVPASQSSYQVIARDALFPTETGVTLSLADDDFKTVELAQAFTFYGKVYSAINVNSDGNLTFVQPDISSSARDLGRFAGGPPRIAPLFTDLDPSNPGAGPVYYRNDPDGIIFVWDGVPSFSGGLYTSFSVKLYNNGSVEFVYGARVDTPKVIAGISPGAGLDGISAIDYSAGLPSERLSGSIAEVFTPGRELSESAIARMFFRNHPDEFDQLVVFLAFPFDLGNAFSYELNVRNDVLGIGSIRGLTESVIFDDSGDYGSGGRLKSFVMMGGLGEFPSDPKQTFMRTYNSLEVVTHEVAHRWLAFPLLREGGIDTLSLLHTTDQAHWSFFFNADASLMEGNQIVDRGQGQGSQRFITSEVTDRFSALDRYLMGFLGANDVPPMFYVKNPVSVVPPRSSTSLPSFQPTVFDGTRWDFALDDLIAANGPRVPSVYQSQKVHRLAFILVSDSQRQHPATQEQIAMLQSLHDAWVPYFNELTGGQAWAVTNPQSSPATTPSTTYFPFFAGDSTRYTGIALANWGPTPTDVLFRAYDNSGDPMSTPGDIINPRMITIPPGGQVAIMGEQIHGLALDGPPRNGWIQAEAGSSQVTGFFLEGDIKENYLDGAVAGDKTSTWLCFTRARGTTGALKNVISIVNPGASSVARLSLSLMNPDGSPRGPATQRQLPPHGRLAEDLSSLFPGIDPQFTGYMTVTSDAGVLGYESFAGSSTVFSLPAQSSATAATMYSAQFASGPAGVIRYFTDLNLINTSRSSRNVEIALINNDGELVPGAFNPARISLGPGEQRLSRGEALFGLPDASSAVTISEGTLVISADGSGVIGDVTFGDPLAGSFLAGLPLNGAPAANFVLSQVAEGNPGAGKAYFTGVAMYNPNSNDVRVTLEVYSAQGTRTGTQTILLPRGTRRVGTLPQLVPAITGQLGGYIRLSSDGGPIIAFELFGDANLSFLAAVPPQVINP